MTVTNWQSIPAVVRTAFATANNFELEDSLVIFARIGSHSHGTYLPPNDPKAIDDIDYMGVVIPPPARVLGVTKVFENWTYQEGEHDVVVYSLFKFLRLLWKSNPNVIGVLWLRPEDYIAMDSEVWSRLHRNRRLFSTKHAHTAFTGYAYGQFKKMTTYTPAIDAEILALTAELEAAGWLLSEIMDGRSLPMPKGIDPQIANDKKQRLRSLRAQFNQAYMGDKRRNLVRDHGYDTKNAAHLIRLMRMCIEFLANGELQVFRGGIDAATLIDIKQGKWSLDGVKEHAEALFDAANIAVQSSGLPAMPDDDQISELSVLLHRIGFRWNEPAPF